EEDDEDLGLHAQPQQHDDQGDEGDAWRRGQGIDVDVERLAQGPEATHDDADRYRHRDGKAEAEAIDGQAVADGDPEPSLAEQPLGDHQGRERRRDEISRNEFGGYGPA